MSRTKISPGSFRNLLSVGHFLMKISATSCGDLIKTGTISAYEDSATVHWTGRVHNIAEVMRTSFMNGPYTWKDKVYLTYISLPPGLFCCSLLDSAPGRLACCKVGVYRL